MSALAGAGNIGYTFGQMPLEQMMTYADCFSEPPVLTAEQSQLLADQEINQEQPGTILKDFQTVLAFIGPEGVPSRGKHKLLPMKSLGELNSLMTRPVELCLKRPQQRSYAYLHGLCRLAERRPARCAAASRWDRAVSAAGCVPRSGTGRQGLHPEPAPGQTRKHLRPKRDPVLG